MGFDRVVLEYPVGWVDPNSDPLSGQHSKCLETIKTAASELSLGFSTRVGLRMADFAPRIAPANTLLISVHTVGIAKNVVRLKESYLPGYYCFDRTGYSGWAELAFNSKMQALAKNYRRAECANFVSKIRDDKLKYNSSKYQQAELEVNAINFIKKPYILLALQTTDDIVARLSNVRQDLLSVLIAEKIKPLGINLYIKRHPFCRDKHVECSINKLACEYDFVYLTDKSVNELIPDAKAVITVNSGVGFEALVMGVPVAVAGKSDYSPVAKQLYSENDVQTFDIDQITRCADTVDSYLYFYLNEYCMRIGDVEYVKNKLIKWTNDEYSSMSDIAEYFDDYIEYVQEYISELEWQRRNNILEKNGRDTCVNQNIINKNNKKLFMDSIMCKFVSLGKKLFD